MLQIRNLTRQFGAKAAVDRASLIVDCGVATVTSAAVVGLRADVIRVALSDRTPAVRAVWVAGRRVG